MLDLPRACVECDELDLSDNPYPHCKLIYCKNGIGFDELYSAGLLVKNLHFIEVSDPPIQH